MKNKNPDSITKTYHMKTAIKTIFLFFALIFSIAILPAQTISLGVRAGSNLATAEIGSPLGISLDAGNLVGLDLAAVLNIGLTKAFSIQPEVHFQQKGWKFEFAFFDETIEENFHLNYLEVPVLAKYAFGLEKVQGFVLAGPSVGMGMGGKAKISEGGIEEEEDITFGSGEEELKKYDLGVALGGGIGIKVGGGQIFLDVRYLLGLTNLSNVEEDDLFSFNNRGIAVGIGALFPLGR